MNESRPSPSWSNRLLLLLALAACVHAWIGPLPLFPEARAQVPDAGAQRRDLVEEQRKTNQILTEIRDLLRSKTLRVEVVKPKEDDGG